MMVNIEGKIEREIENICVAPEKVKLFLPMLLNFINLLFFDDAVWLRLKPSAVTKKSLVYEQKPVEENYISVAYT